MNFHFPSGERGYYYLLGIYDKNGGDACWNVYIAADSQHFCKGTKLSVLNLIEQRELARKLERVVIASQALGLRVIFTK